MIRYVGSEVVDRHCDGSLDRSMGACLFCHQNEQAARVDRLDLLSGWTSKTFEGVLEFAVNEVGVDLRRGEVAMAEGTLDNQDIPGSAVEVGCEGVAQDVWAQLLVDTCGCKPVVKPPGHLALAESFTAVREEQCPAFTFALASACGDVRSQEGTQGGL